MTYDGVNGSCMRKLVEHAKSVGEDGPRVLMVPARMWARVENAAFGVARAAGWAILRDDSRPMPSPVVLGAADSRKTLGAKGV